MKERIISGAVMTVLVVAALLIGGYVFDAAISIIAIIGLHELLNVRKDVKIPIYMKILAIVAMLFVMMCGNKILPINLELSVNKIALIFIALFIPTLFLTKQEYKVSNAFYLIGATLFIGIVFNLFISLYNDSLYKLAYIILVACMTDIFALFGGKLIGKHKLTKISPKKTIEGSIVGSLISTIVSTTFYMCFIDTKCVAIVILVTLLLSIVGQMGDLFFSLIKRENDIKDYSHLIPGHGGVLDRIDSLIFILIVFNILAKFI